MDPTDYEGIARRTANVIGPNSAAAQALAELDRRRAAGEVVAIRAIGRHWVVMHGDVTAYADKERQ